MTSTRVRKKCSMKPFKYEFETRKEEWKRLNGPLEKLLMIPPEERAEIVQGLVSETCYIDLASMLGLTQKPLTTEAEGSAETLIPFIPPDQDSQLTIPKISHMRTSKAASEETISYSITSSQYYNNDSMNHSLISDKPASEPTLEEIMTKTELEPYDILSDFVEVEKKMRHDEEQMLKHKAILRFLSLPEAEAASWRVKETKDVNDLSEMTLEEQGDFLINKIAVDFCEWLRKLGGDEKSFINEEILKELFQVGMDNPASRAICVRMKEMRVLYQRMADFLQVPEKSFHEVLTEHLNWDVQIEKKDSKVIAFEKSLPNDQKFKTPKNKTAETWLEWNKMDPAQLSFADVYGPIKDLRSTKEYCRWLAGHAEHKKPQYLVDQGMFRRGSTTIGPVDSKLALPGGIDSSKMHSTLRSFPSNYYSRKSTVAKPDNDRRKSFLPNELR